MNERFSQVPRFLTRLSVRGFISLGILTMLISGCEWGNSLTPAGSNSPVVAPRLFR
ncbi:MAG TPA: hypothetical protein IGS53_21510 [Leptolyngbyaceae cyanobacterium M33_DOE_097]|nr:hypothetical protein [Leptolyngbyaceae cyanobacterium M33_DOE_097]